MQHYSLEQWVDFARNVIGKQERASMQDHLDSGCKQCSKALGLWQRVHEAGRQERRYEPPDSAVRTIKGTFAIQGPRRPARGTREIASLLFDSSRSPLTAGVRSTGTAARQLLYGVGEFRVDVRIEPKSDSDNVTVMGQILDFANRGARLSDVPVALVRSREVLGESATNRFGEFHLECDLEAGFQLRVKLPSKEVTLPIAMPVTGSVEDVAKHNDSKGVSRNLERTKKSTRKKV